MVPTSPHWAKPGVLTHSRLASTSSVASTASAASTSTSSTSRSGYSGYSGHSSTSSWAVPAAPPASPALPTSGGVGAATAAGRSFSPLPRMASLDFHDRPAPSRTPYRYGKRPLTPPGSRNHQGIFDVTTPPPAPRPSRRMVEGFSDNYKSSFTLTHDSTPSPLPRPRAAVAAERGAASSPSSTLSPEPTAGALTAGPSTPSPPPRPQRFDRFRSSLVWTKEGLVGVEDDAPAGSPSQSQGRFKRRSLPAPGGSGARTLAELVSGTLPVPPNPTKGGKRRWVN